MSARAPAPGAEVVESREILPGQWLQAWHAPHLANGSRAGQFVHVRTRDPSGSVMRRPLPINTADAASGVVTVHVRADRPAHAWLADRRPGDRLEATGPLGRPFEVDSRSQHLLLAAEGMGIAAVRMLAGEAVRDGRQVTLLFGAAGAHEVYPSNLLPDEVEYVVATADGTLGQRGSIVDLVPAYEAWADQAFAAAPAATLGALARLAATRRGRLGVATLGRKRGGGRPDPPGSAAARRKAFLQVAVDQPIGCAGAVCLGCAVLGAGGVPQRACREGPVFASGELAWDDGA